MKNRDIKLKETKPMDTSFEGYNFEEFHDNRLSLTPEIKQELNDKGLDWRFINGTKYRVEGNFHHSRWQPYKFSGENSVGMALTPEGFLQRGDLLLAVRPKSVTSQHKAHLKQRNIAYSGKNQHDAEELRKMAREAGLGRKVRITEGYEENE